MSRTIQRLPDPSAQARVRLLARLQARRGEIERAVLTRIYAIPDPDEEIDPEYREGLRAAVSAALDYSLASIERGERRAPPIPAALLAQARLAALGGVSLDAVMRRYVAGYTLLGDYLVGEAEDGGLLGNVALKRLLRAQAVIFDRLLAAVSDEHTRETRNRLDSFEQRRAKRIQGLLDGELLDVSDIPYDFDVCHLGLVAAGVEAAAAIRELARSLGHRLLLIRHSEEIAWAWFGSGHPIDLDQVYSHVSSCFSPSLPLALGEPCQGLSGWRVTHQQAKAALSVVLRSPRNFARYSEVALVASILRDDLLAKSLRDLFLSPLEDARGNGKTLRDTLRAYFSSGRSTSSAAALLGVSRPTVANRLRTIEDKIGQPLNEAHVEVEVALRLFDLGMTSEARNGALETG